MNRVYLVQQSDAILELDCVKFTIAEATNANYEESEIHL
jgi:hypothetical protein